MRLLFIFLLIAFAKEELSSQEFKPKNPILFVTQIPTFGFTSIGQTFSNHNAWIDNAPRGGDLMIVYPSGKLRNLTKEANFGANSDYQGANAIAVRQPSVHWSGKKALFSMVIGAPTKIWDVSNQFWQIYEVSGLGENEIVEIKKVELQPSNVNNISPIYGSDDKIIFTSDLPHNKQMHLWPQLDEYENARVVTGLWSLDRQTGEVKLLEHSPSGSFYPTIDSYGRVIFSRWDHLQRDQQADLDRKGGGYGTFNYESEAPNAKPLDTRKELFPEPRDITDPDYNPKYARHIFNQFFPWEINQDGTEEETINHVGRHEFGGTYTEGSFVGDPNLKYLVRRSYIKNKGEIIGDGGLLHIRESSVEQGVYYASKVREFSRESAGQIIKFTGQRGLNPEDMEIIDLTHPATASSAEDGKPASENHTGHYRNPLYTSDDILMASHCESKYANRNEGSGKNPKPRYNFRIRKLNKVGDYYQAGEYLIPPQIRKTSYYNGNDYLVERTDTLWELDAVEVVATKIPPLTKELPLQKQEQDVFNEEKVNIAEFKSWLKKYNMSVLVSRDVTTRDRNDNQQPYNLKVPGGVSTNGGSGKEYEVEFVQIFQADLLRGQGGIANPRPGRRVLPQYLHDSIKYNNIDSKYPAGSVKIGLDGSMAAFVPAMRALTWQLTNSANEGVVKERYWITTQPGEIRFCGSCHGVNKLDQSGQNVPQNKPEALRDLLRHWKANYSNSSVEDEKSAIAVYPNPFNKINTLELAISQDSKMKVSVLDMTGKVLQTLANGDYPIGIHKFEFNADALPQGSYQWYIDINGVVYTRKVILVR
jgi:hypothetical protein